MNFHYFWTYNGIRKNNQAIFFKKSFIGMIWDILNLYAIVEFGGFLKIIIILADRNFE